VSGRKLPGIAANLSGNVAIQLTGLASVVLAGRLFDPTERGRLAAAVVWALTVSVVADLGVSQAVPYYAAKRRQGVGASAMMVVLSTSLVAIPCFLLVTHLLDFELSFASIVYAAFGAPLSLIVAYMVGVHQGESRYPSFNLCRVLGSASYLVGLVVIAFAAQPTADAVLWVAFTVSLMACSAVVLWTRRAAPAFGTHNGAVSRDLISYGLRAYPGKLAFVGSQSIPPLLVGGIGGAASLGYYSVAQSYAIVPLMVAGAFAQLAPASIASRCGDDAIRECRRLCLFGMLSATLTALLLAPLAELALPLVFGPSYMPSGALASLLVVVSAIAGVNLVLTASLQAIGRPAVASWGAIAGLATTLALGPFLVRQLGAWGAAWTALASAAVATSVMLPVGFARRKKPVPTVKISIITPAFNAAPFIRDLLDSVQAQTYRSFEHIVIDDGSTDNTYELLTRSPDVTAIRRANKGQVATQNELLGLATGDVVVLICADDYFAGPQALRTVAEAFAQTPAADVVVGRTPRKVEGDREYVVRPDLPLWIGKHTVSVCPAVQHCSVFVRRELIERNNIRFDESYRMRADWDFLVKVFGAAGRIRSVRADLGTWRQHPKQTSVLAGELGEMETARMVSVLACPKWKHRLLRSVCTGYGRLAHLCAMSVQCGPAEVWHARHNRRARRNVGATTKVAADEQVVQDSGVGDDRVLDDAAGERAVISTTKSHG